MPLTPGTRFGPYEIVSPLGAGGMGEVYRARDGRLSREVALKVLPDEFSADAARRQRFEHEARAVAALNHPNIVAIHDVGEERGAAYIVTELVDGASLRDARLGLRQLVEVATQIASGLAAAHAVGLVHRDLKPENIMLTRDGRVKILDFGLAKVIAPRGQASQATETVLMQTQPGIVVGTVGYMSPEQARGQDLDHRSDIFSLGAVLYELASGKHPFEGASAADIVSAILKDDPPELGGGIPPALDRNIRRCLEKEPARRFQSAADLAFALQSAAGDSNGAPRTPAAPRITRRTALWTGGVVAAGALGLGAARFLTPGERPVPRYRLIPTWGDRVTSAVLHPDGKSVVYAAAADGKTTVFQQDLEGGPPRSLALPEGSRLMALSGRGELAFCVGDTLYRTPLANVAPRAVLENVLAANWSGDGEELQVERRVGNKYQLEFPAGHVIFENDLLLSAVALAPRSGRSAFALFTHDGPELHAVDRAGRDQKLFEAQGQVMRDSGAVWSPDEREVWMAPLDGHDPSALAAYSGSQRERILTRLPGDVSVIGMATGGAVLLELTWNDRSAVVMQSAIAQAAEPRFFTPDGSALLLESGGGFDSNTYLKKAGVSAPVLLGKGRPSAISPDGRLVQVFRNSGGYTLVPTGPGEERKVEVPGVELPAILAWLGTRWLVVGHDEKRGPTLHEFFLFDPASGNKEKLKLELRGEQSRFLVSPDGARALFQDYHGKWSWAGFDGTGPMVVSAIAPDETVYRWTADGRGFYLGKEGGSKLAVERYDVESGKRTLWKEFSSGRPDLTIGSFTLTPDGTAWAYALNRTYTRLALAEGLS